MDIGKIEKSNYNDFNRLTAMTDGTNAESYTYDAVGNRTASHLSSGYTTGAFNRLTGTTSATASYSYNNNGSLISKAAGGVTTSYAWDRENRMIFAKKDSQWMNYQYDALGRWVSNTFYPSGILSPGFPTKFTYDGLDVIFDDNSLLEGIPSVSYQNAPGIDEKLEYGIHETQNYFLQDHLGSTIALADSGGKITDSNSYDSFGNASNANFPSRYQYTGREHDTFTGLQYSRARFYDPQIGRFISEDPIGFGGGENWYGYVGNNPINLYDPYGLFPTPRFSQRCDAWRKLIENITKQIATRIGEMHEDGKGLPWRTSNDFQKPSESRFGHKNLIDKLKAKRAEYEAYVKAYCDDDENDGNRAPEACKAKSPIDLSQPTPEEIRLQIDAAENMEQFWTKILIGGAAAGAGYLAPGLIPTLVPALPKVLPQYAH